MKNVRVYIFLYFTAATALEVVYRCLDRMVWKIPPQWGLTILEQATGYYFAMALLPLVFRVTRRWPIQWTFARIGIHGAAVAIFAVVHTSLMWGSRAILSPLLGLGSYDYGRMPLRYVMEFPRQLINYAMWVAAFTIYQSWLRTKDLETQLVSARLESLSHQLQPHFLFNALNAVSATMYEDLGRADRMLERICDFLRATLRLPDSPMVPVSTELALARQYLEVMKARLEDRLQFEIHCESGADDARVPALLLQPLVENAVEHGQDPATGRLNIAIDVRQIDRFIEISIRDHGPGYSKNGAGYGPGGAIAPAKVGDDSSRKEISGRGISNVQRRLQTVYGDRATLRLNGHRDGGAVVEIQIPA
jgi:two-component system LytT family sensor kinase